MSSELFICSVRRPVLELIAKDLELEMLPCAVAGFVDKFVVQRDLDSKRRSFFRDELDLILFCNDLKGEARVLDHNALYAHSARVPTSTHLDLGAMVIRSGQFRRCALASRVYFTAQDFFYVSIPEAIQGPEDLKLAPILGDIVQATFATLSRGERLGLQSLCALLLILASLAARLTGILRGRGRVRSQEERPVLDLVAEDALCVVGAVGARKQFLRYGWAV